MLCQRKTTTYKIPWWFLPQIQIIQLHKINRLYWTLHLSLTFSNSFSSKRQTHESHLGYWWSMGLNGYASNPQNIQIKQTSTWQTIIWSRNWRNFKKIKPSINPSVKSDPLPTRYSRWHNTFEYKNKISTRFVMIICILNRLDDISLWLCYSLHFLMNSLFLNYKRDIYH